MLDLFSGIGGFSLAASWCADKNGNPAYTTKAFCEIDPYCQKVLHKHWPDVPIFSDIKELRGEDVGTVDIVCGGFPCQPYSVAGNRLGERDERNLWPEYLRIIQETRPTWIVGENVSGLISTIHETVCSDMEKEKHKVRSFSLPAYSVGAPHERYRFFIIGYSENQPRLQADTQTNPQRVFRETRQRSLFKFRDSLPGTYWETHKPPICGVDDGLSLKLDGYKSRMMALGNSIVPQVAFQIFKAIVEVTRQQAAGE